MIYYTADLHFGYAPVMEQAMRPFRSLEEMDETLISNWNSVVGDDDTVYVLGDIGGHCTPFPSRQLERLRGHKHLIRGNHDSCLPDQKPFLEHFETVTDFLEIDDGENHIALCHYPLVYMQLGYMIHGHIHNTKMHLHDILAQLPRVLNAGVDINAFFPVTLDQLIGNNRIYYNDPLRTALEQQLKPGRKPKWKAEFYPLPTKTE